MDYYGIIYAKKDLLKYIELTQHPLSHKQHFVQFMIFKQLARVKSFNALIGFENMHQVHKHENWLGLSWAKLSPSLELNCN